MVNIYPKLYRKSVVFYNRVKVIYVKLKKELYGILYIALLFYLKLKTDLKNNGFSLNYYGPCVANRLVNGDMMPVVWYVYDLKVSHK